MFVDPRPRSADKSMPLEEFMSRFEALPSEHVEALVVDLLQRQTDVFPAIAQAIRHHLDAARAREDFRREVVRVLLWLGEPVAFALSPSAEKLYPLKSFVWDLDPSHHDVMETLNEGILAITPAQHKLNSIDRAVANRPILLEGASANRLLEIRPPSLARQREVAQAVIDAFTANHPAERMTRAEFMAAVRRQLPGLSRDAIIRTCWKLAPEDWKRPGPKRRADLP